MPIRAKSMNSMLNIRCAFQPSVSNMPPQLHGMLSLKFKTINKYAVKAVITKRLAYRAWMVYLGKRNNRAMAYSIIGSIQTIQSAKLEI